MHRHRMLSHCESLVSRIHHYLCCYSHFEHNDEQLHRHTKYEQIPFQLNRFETVSFTSTRFRLGVLQFLRDFVSIENESKQVSIESVRPGTLSVKSSIHMRQPHFNMFFSSIHLKCFTEMRI